MSDESVGQVSGGGGLPAAATVVSAATGVGTGSVLSTPPPANASTPAPAIMDGQSGASSADWTSSFDADAKTFVQNKEFKTPADLLSSYRNLEKLVGAADKVVKIPDSMDTPEGRALWERLGAPKDSKDYKVEFSPENKPDPKFVESLVSAFHESGTPKAMAEKIVAKLNEYQTNAKQLALEGYSAKFKEAENNLKKEWGAAYDQNFNLANKGMKSMGLTTKEVDGISFNIGHDRAMKVLQVLGVSAGEHSFVGGRQEAGIMEPAQAQAQIKALIADKEFGKRVLAGEHDATQRWNSLNKQAAPGDMNF